MKLPHWKNACLFLLWPVLLIPLITVIAAMLVAVWPLILTDKCTLGSDEPKTK